MPARGVPCDRHRRRSTRASSPCGIFPDAPVKAVPFLGAHVLKLFPGHGDFVGRVVRLQNIPGFPFRI